MAETSNNIQEPVYLNYGDNQRVVQGDFLEKAANSVTNYVQNQPWSRKKKEKFMEAYTNIMNNGVKGASIKGGRWHIDINENFEIPEQDRQMYQEAAYFIQQQMQGLASTTEAKKEDKKKAIPFTNEEFTKGFQSHLQNKLFGGQPWIIGGPEDNWNYRDERDAQGKRGITNRANLMAKYLEDYGNTIKEDQFNFEGSPFTDYNDFKTRLNNAVNALRSSETEDDIPALDALGLNYKTYFNNGTGDPFTKDDYTGTYGDYYNRYLPELQKKQQQVTNAELEERKKNPLYIMSTRVGQGALPTKQQLADKYGSTEGLLNKVIEYGQKGFENLSSDETRELVAAFRYGANSSITDEEYNILRNHATYRGASKSRFKKFGNIGNMVLDTATGQVISIYDQQTKDARGLDFLSGQSSQDLKQQENQRRIFGENGLSGADIADISAALIDAVGVGATFVPVVGNVLGAGTGLVGSLTHFGADISRDGLDLGDIGRLALNAGFDLGTLIPGLGTAAKAGKLAKAIGKWIPGIVASIGAIQGLTNGKEIINSFSKLAHPSTVTVEDLQNISQGIALLAGGVNIGRGYKQSKKFKSGIEAQEATVTTQKGQKVKLNEQEYNTINSKNATKEAKQQALESAVQRHNTNNQSNKIDLTNDGLVYKGRSVTHPLRTAEKSTDVDLLTAPVKGKPHGVDVTSLRRDDIRHLAQHRWKAHILPGKTLEQKLNWTNNGIYTRGWNTSNRSTNNSETVNTSLSQQQNIQQSTNNQPRVREVLDNFEATGKSPISPKHNMTRSEWKKANKKLYDDINRKGRFTNNMPEEGTYQFKDPVGNIHTFRLIQRDDDFLLDIKSSNGSSKQAVLTLDQVKKGIWENIKQSLNTGLRNNISLPANIIRTLQGTAYGWLKQGGRIDRQKMQKYKEYNIGK